MSDVLRRKTLFFSTCIPFFTFFAIFDAFIYPNADRLHPSLATVAAIPEMVERGQASLIRFYESLDAYLADNEFVAGDSFSIADITALCTIDFAAGAARVPIPESCTNVLRWHESVSSRDSAKA